MRRYIDPRTKRYISSVLTTYLAILVAILLAYTTNRISGLQAIVTGAGGLIVALVAEYYLTYGPLLKYRDKQLSTFFEDYLRLIEEDIEILAPGDVEVRANVMRPTSGGFRDKQTYSIAFWHDEADYSDAEFELEFNIGQGCVGKTHQENQQLFCISPNHRNSWEGTWNTTRIQEEIAGHLNTIIGTPIYRPSVENPEDPVAVLIIDSEDEIDEFVELDEDEMLADIEFKETAIAKRAVRHAKNAGILL